MRPTKIDVSCVVFCGSSSQPPFLYLARVFCTTSILNLEAATCDFEGLVKVLGREVARGTSRWAPARAEGIRLTSFVIQAYNLSRLRTRTRPAQSTPTSSLVARPFRSFHFCLCVSISFLASSAFCSLYSLTNCMLRSSTALVPSRSHGFTVEVPLCTRFPLLAALSILSYSSSPCSCALISSSISSLSFAPNGTTYSRFSTALAVG